MEQMDLVNQNDLKITSYRLLGSLPDPFLKEDGTRLASKQEWSEHRKTLMKTAVELQYGIQPPAPKCFSVQRTYGFPLGKKPALHVFRITAGSEEKTLSFRAFCLLPNAAYADPEARFPVIISGDGCFPYHLNEEYRAAALEQDVALVFFDRTELAPDVRSIGNVGPLYEVYPRPHYTFGALGAWAWGYSRVVDALEQLEELPLDLSRICFTGHSRGAKTAALAGVLDERAYLVNPNATCAGACGCYRIHMAGEHRGEKERRSETLADLLRRFAFWMGEGMADYAEREEELPFDCHFLKALVAPRYLYVSEGAGDLWGNPVGSYQTTLAAREVYRFLGIEERLFWSFRPGGHRQGPRDFSNLVTLIKHLDGKAPLTEDFFRLPFDPPPAAWSWTVPQTK